MLCVFGKETLDTLLILPQPCSLNDFMDYLAYVEINAENLQFYLWYKDYVRRFEALPESEKALSPEFVPEPDEIPDLTKDVAKGERRKTKREASSSLMETGYGRNGSVPSTTSHGIPHGQSQVHLNKEQRTTGTPSVMSESTALPSDAEFVSQAGLKWQPCGYSFVRILILCADSISYHSAHERRDQQSHEALSCIYRSSRTEHFPQRPSTMSSRIATHNPPLSSRTSSQNRGSCSPRPITSQLHSMVDL